MAMQVGGGGGGVKSDINVTPLVDVMLVLLIIMMIVAPLLQQGVPVTLPLAAHSVDKPDTQDQTVIAVDRNRRYHVGTQEVDLRDLRRQLLAVFETKRGVREVIIKADEDVEFSAVMALMDELREIEIEDIGLITETRSASGQEGE
jgi:biopolymer transport protein TolR